MKKIILLLVIVFIGINTTNAQKITTKKSFGSYIYKQNDKFLSSKKMLFLMEDNKEAFGLMKSANKNKTWATILGGAGGALVGFPIGTAIGGGDAKWELAGVGAALILVAIPLNTKYNKKSKKAVDLYNNQMPTTAANFNPTFNLNLKGNSIGIIMSF